MKIPIIPTVTLRPFDYFCSDCPTPDCRETASLFVDGNYQAGNIIQNFLCSLYNMALALSVCLGLAVGASPVSAAAAATGLEQIEHVVLFMQENRAFNHYFGTMAGVRGFNDPNVQVNSDGRSVWYQ